MWKKLEHFDKELLNREVMLQHHAVQFIARAGKHLIPEKADDSHTNMEWKAPVSSFVGNYLPHFLMVGLCIPDLRLILYNENYYILHSLELPGLTGKKIFKWLNEALLANKVESQSLKYDLHYKIPEHEKFNDHPFSEPQTEIAEATAALRSVANEILEEWAEEEPSAAAVKIWPHHFDTGTFFPWYDKDGNMTKSIGLGLAIADELVDEPYFYVNHWTAEEIKNYPNLETPGDGQWIIGDWKGSVLPYSAVSSYESAKEQEKAVRIFFDESVRLTRELLK